jgi:hypothetical protein
VWTLKRRYAEGHLPVVHVQEVQEPPAEVDQTPGCRETPPVQGLGNRLEGRARDADSAQRRRDSRQTDSHSENAIGAARSCQDRLMRRQQGSRPAGCVAERIAH